MTFAIFAGLAVFVVLGIKAWGIYAFRTRALAAVICFGLTLGTILLLTLLALGTTDWHFVIGGFWAVFIIKLTRELQRGSGER